MKTVYVIEDFLEEDIFDQIVALFKFQIPFLDDEKNYWCKEGETYVNNVFDLMSRPSNYYIKLKEKFLDTKFLTRVFRDELKKINYEIQDKNIKEISIEGCIIPPNSSIQKTRNISWFEDETNCINLKMVLFTHEYWDPSWYSDYILYNDIKKTTIICKPNKLICLATDDVDEYSVHNNSSSYYCSVVCYVKIDCKNISVTGTEVCVCL